MPSTTSQVIGESQLLGLRLRSTHTSGGRHTFVDSNVHILDKEARCLIEE